MFNEALSIYTTEVEEAWLLEHHYNHTLYDSDKRWDTRDEIKNIRAKPLIYILSLYFRVAQSGNESPIPANVGNGVDLPNEELVNGFITGIDNRINEELRVNWAHWRQKGVTRGWDFHRLSGMAKLALYLDYHRIWKEVMPEEQHKDWKPVLCRGE